MATVDYTAKAATARRLLTKFGQTGKIKRITRTGGSPSSGGGTTTTREIDSVMVVLPIDGKDIDGTLIQAGDFWTYVEDIGENITTADKLICNEGELSIIDPRRFAPAGDVVLWQILARR